MSRVQVILYNADDRCLIFKMTLSERYQQSRVVQSSMLLNSLKIIYITARFGFYGLNGQS